jgi:hypothetical protein
MRYQLANRLGRVGAIELAILVVEEDDLAQAKHLCCSAELGLTHSAQRVRSWIGRCVALPAALAARGGHQEGRNSLGGVSRQDAACAKRLVVGMCQDAHES